MCTRFAQAETPEELCERFDARPSAKLAALLQEGGKFGGRYNLSATQSILVIVLGKDGVRELTPMEWGLVPPTADHPKVGSRMINARAETVATLAAFRDAFRQRRCLIPASAFYEWRKEGATKQPFAFRRHDHEPFVFAGVWEEWRPTRPEGRWTCSIITTTANSLVAGISPRMPVILPFQDEAAWLVPEQHVDLLRDVLHPYPSEEMEMYPVSADINRLGNEGAVLLERLERVEASEPLAVAA